MRPAAGPFPFPTIPRPVRQFAALSAVVIAFLASRMQSAVVDEGGLFLLLSVTVLGAAWFAGTGAALSVTVLGAVLGGSGSWTRPTLAVHTHLALFVVEGLLLTALVAELRHARRVAEHAASDADHARHDVELASRTKDEFLGTISHELRTPLNAVLGWLHLVRSGKLDRATEARGLEAIERNVRLQAQLTTDLLDVSRALTGRLSFAVAVVPLKTPIEEAVSQVVTAAQAKDVTLHVTMVPGQPTVRGDATRLRQVFWHLLANAIKFTPRGGKIYVSLEADDTAAVIVRDTGPGVAPEFLPRIFERFTQADSSLTRGSGGLGVGLALVRDLVERHGGDIRADNDPAGGAVFTVRLPLHPEDQPLEYAGRDTRRTGDISPQLDGIRVVILDRDREARELLSLVLQQRGASVRTAASVHEALEMLEAWRPDVLVSDTASPERDAYALVGRVPTLEAERGGRIPAVALTSFARTDDAIGRLLAGAKRDLPKSVEPAVLTAEIARLAGRERRKSARG
ncbi:MAG TPA: hybrid sensor histidine kinase/response regulator [Vicinamibacterales bacterium]|jgi:signal transduction histidine kinase/ActR/RegA family two-component response regulator